MVPRRWTLDRTHWHTAEQRPTKTHTDPHRPWCYGDISGRGDRSRTRLARAREGRILREPPARPRRLLVLGGSRRMKMKMTMKVKIKMEMVVEAG